jgi:hypothetical protein
VYTSHIITNVGYAQRHKKQTRINAKGPRMAIRTHATTQLPKEYLSSSLKTIKELSQIISGEVNSNGYDLEVNLRIPHDTISICIRPSLPLLRPSPLICLCLIHIILPIISYK